MTQKPNNAHSYLDLTGLENVTFITPLWRASRQLSYLNKHIVVGVKQEVRDMVDPKIVKKQLDRIGEPISFLWEAELNELPHILMEGEEIQHVIGGRYSGGFAIMCATNLRLLLVDKKLLFLTVEDVRYDMIAELDYGHQWIGATVHIRSFSKDLKFESWKKLKLRNFTTYVQHRVMELRQQQSQTSPMIPLQTFDEPAGALTAEQAQSVVPLSAVSWYRANPPVQMMNPYVQSPLMTRKRVGRFDLAGK